MTRQQPVPQVVVVGGGFGGLACARALARKPVRVTLVDRANHHLFQPLLYQVATAGLSPGDIASPIRAILRRHRNIQVLLGEVTQVDVEERRVVLRDGELRYDFLVLATGARHAYFGHDEWEADAPGLKSLDDALEIRRKVLLAFEAAERVLDPAMRKALLTFVVVGGGPTGVELAGAIAEIARKTVARDFRDIDPRKSRVLLVEAGPRILSAFPEALSVKAEASLHRLGVEVLKGVAVTEVAADHVKVGDQVIPTWVTLWAAGVAASFLGRGLGVPLDRAGRVKVERDLTLPGHPEVSVIGDLAHSVGPEGRPYPGVAPVATQQGKAAARNILRHLQGQPPESFEYRDRGNMATIGRAAAVAEVKGFELSGFVAWLAWLFIHILFLIGFENRLSVMLKWVFAYFSHQRSARLITGEVKSILPRGVAAPASTLSPTERRVEQA